MKIHVPSCLAILSLSVLCVPQTSDAALILSESFDYVDQAAYNANWSAGTFNPTGQDHANLADEAGGSADVQNARFGLALGVTLGDTAETVFLSYLFQTPSIDHTDTSGTFRVFEFHNGSISGGTNREYAIGLLRADGNAASNSFEHRDYNQAVGTGASAFGTADTNLNLLVLRIDWSAPGTFTADAWLNPDGLTDFNTASNRVSGTGLEFTHVAMASFADGAGPSNFDEIRIGTQVADLQLVPEPSSTALLGLGCVSFLLRRRR